MKFKLLSEVNYNLENGNVVNLPHDILEKLNKKSKDLPYYFELCTQSFLKSYVGVLEFTADQNTIQIPPWLNDQLSIGENQVIDIKLLENIPQGKYVKLRPESENFFDIPEYESCLETQLSKFPILYQGQIISINIFDKDYEIKIEEIDQDWEKFDFDKGTECLELNVINVVNTDINVDINNQFLKRKLEKIKFEEEKRLEEEKLRKKLESEQRELQKAKAVDLESKSSNVFNGDGNKLSDVSTNMSREEIRLARLKFLEKKNKNKENSNKDLDV